MSIRKDSSSIRDVMPNVHGDPRAALARVGSTVRLGSFTKTSSTIIAAAMKYGPATAHALARNLSIPIATQKPPSPTVQFTCSAIIFALGNVMRISRNGDSWRSYHTAWHRLQICQEPIDDLYVVKKKISDLNFFSNGTWRDHWPHAETSRRAGGRPSNN